MTDENWWDTEPAKPGLVLAYTSGEGKDQIHGAAVYMAAPMDGLPNGYWVLTGSSGLFDWDYVVSWLRFINADIRTLDGMILQRPGRIT